MLLLDLANCGPSGLLRVIYFFKLILDILFIIVPIGLIILLLIDFSKMVISGDEGAQSKTFKLAMKRILYAVIVFFVPTIVSIFNSILGDLGVEYSACYNDITIDAINQLAAEEEAIEEAEKAARLALLEEERKEAEENEKILKKINSSGTHLASGSGCDGMVYYEDGVFYKPSSATSGSDGTKGSTDYGYNKYFYEMLKKFLDDAASAGWRISMSTTEYGAWRPIAIQEYFYGCYVNQDCNNGNSAAVPGYSNHGWGIASDLEYSYYQDRQAAIKWAHDNASNYGLRFSEPDENWHIEPASIVKDDSKVKVCK